MFYRFNQHKQKHAIQDHSGVDRLASRIVKNCLKYQRKISDWVNIQIRKLPAPLQRSLFQAVLIFATLYSIVLIVQGVNLSPETIQTSHAIRKIWTSITRHSEPLEPVKSNQAFEAYIDSLEKVFVQDSIRDHNLKNDNDGKSELPIHQ